MNSDSGKCALSCAGLTSGYKDAMVVRDISFTIDQGKVFTILGKNGMGKSTLLKSIMALLKRSSGTLALMGEDVSAAGSQELVRRGVAYIPQEDAIFHEMTVEENLRLGTTSDRHLARGLERISAYFPVIPQRRRQKAGTLSGGEQKMLLMARALMGDPKLILIDEISEGLQPAMISTMVDVIARLTADGGATVLMAEQNVHFVSRVSDVVAFIKIGQITEEMRLGTGSRADEELLLLDKMRI